MITYGFLSMETLTMRQNRDLIFPSKISYDSSGIRSLVMLVSLYHLIFVVLKCNFMSKYKSASHSPQTPPRGRQRFCLSGPLHGFPLTPLSQSFIPSKTWEKLPYVKLQCQSFVKFRLILRIFSERTLLKFNLR